MDPRLNEVLEVLLRNIETLNGEIMRLTVSEQFKPTTHSFRLIDRIRGLSLCTLQNMRTLERKLYRAKNPPDKGPGEVVKLRE